MQLSTTVKDVDVENSFYVWCEETNGININFCWTFGFGPPSSPHNPRPIRCMSMRLFLPTSIKSYSAPITSVQIFNPGTCELAICKVFVGCRVRFNGCRKKNSEYDILSSIKLQAFILIHSTCMLNV